MATAEGEAFRDCMISIVDDCRAMIDDDLGLRLHVVKIVRRIWTGPELGQGTFTDTETVIAPRPRVREPSPHLVRDMGGTFEAGDRVVDKLSATLAIDALTGGKLARAEEWLWLIDDEAYSIVAEPDKRYTDWRVQLRRMNRRRAS